MLKYSYVLKLAQSQPTLWQRIKAGAKGAWKGAGKGLLGGGVTGFAFGGPVGTAIGGAAGSIIGGAIGGIHGFSTAGQSAQPAPTPNNRTVPGKGYTGAQPPQQPAQPQQAPAPQPSYAELQQRTQQMEDYLNRKHPGWNDPGRQAWEEAHDKWLKEHGNQGIVDPYSPGGMYDWNGPTMQPLRDRNPGSSAGTGLRNWPNYKMYPSHGSLDASLRKRLGIGKSQPETDQNVWDPHADWLKKHRMHGIPDPFRNRKNPVAQWATGL